MKSCGVFGGDCTEGRCKLYKTCLENGSIKEVNEFTYMYDFSFECTQKVGKKVFEYLKDLENKGELKKLETEYLL